MKTLWLVLALLNAFAVGWFVRDSLYHAVERVYSWKPPAKWAAGGALMVVASLICFFRS